MARRGPAAHQRRWCHRPSPDRVRGNDREAHLKARVAVNGYGVIRKRVADQRTVIEPHGSSLAGSDPPSALGRRATSCWLRLSWRKAWY